uniref:Uncharacterized protein n=1 Tax=Chromera velia CCMP2878 TaxID=1169474 RepID=A0A0G4HCA5_9ALVE|eukprot:Cvel_6303.t1-p1 / transcript=Cvel_6303.t1 / gene=Cvel_6303 / organism=Chromera_velia_CCMP2878 / gene_product=hypothetical protein / transcript_product=hypothetical protein / location=Cvel_scaffold306:13706-17484(+) / protein_length=260 / sequence_SO=supercontig / SO=protein_coding / is_pseudo=false
MVFLLLCGLLPTEGFTGSLPSWRAARIERGLFSRTSAEELGLSRMAQNVLRGKGEETGRRQKTSLSRPEVFRKAGVQAFIACLISSLATVRSAIAAGEQLDILSEQRQYDPVDPRKTSFSRNLPRVQSFISVLKFCEFDVTNDNFFKFERLIKRYGRPATYAFVEMAKNSVTNEKNVTETADENSALVPRGDRALKIAKDLQSAVAAAREAVLRNETGQLRTFFEEIKALVLEFIRVMGLPPWGNYFYQDVVSINVEGPA